MLYHFVLNLFQLGGSWWRTYAGTGFPLVPDRVSGHAFLVGFKPIPVRWNLDNQVKRLQMIRFPNFAH